MCRRKHNSIQMSIFITHHIIIIIIRTRQYQRTRRPLRPFDVYDTVYRYITKGQEYHSIFTLKFFFHVFFNWHVFPWYWFVSSTRSFAKREQLNSRLFAFTKTLQRGRREFYKSLSVDRTITCRRILNKEMFT